MLTDDSARGRPTGSKAEPPLTYLEVLDDEYWATRGEQPTAASKTLRETWLAARGAGGVAAESAEAAFRADVLGRLHAASRSALCFSGGGIRSATFGLGVLQGLASISGDDGAGRPALLGELDFLSTVSGGGYLGSWFSAWATRAAKAPAQTIRDCAEPERHDGPAQVIRVLASKTRSVFDPEPAPVKYLRAYSNYLTPKLGLFSADTWAAVGAVIRNLFLNWLVLLPLLGLLLLLPLGARQVLEAHPAPTPLWLLVISGVALGALGTGYVGYDLPSAGNARNGPVRYCWLCLVPLTLAAVNLNTFWGWLPNGSGNAAWWNLVGLGKTGLTRWHFGIAGALMHGAGMLVGLVVAMIRFRRPATRTALTAIAAAVVTGFAGGLLAFALAGLAGTDATGGLTNTRLYTCAAFPMVMGVFLFAGTLLVGLTSYVTEDKDREWWARAGGLTLGLALAWAVFAAVVLYAGAALGYLGAEVAAATGITGWGAARLAGSGQTPSGRRADTKLSLSTFSTPWAKELAARLALPAFIVLLAMLLSIGNAALVGRVGAVLARLGGVPPLHGVSAVLCVAAVYLVLSLVASVFINVNKFSLHAMYRQRLIRAYLGASNTHRNPNRLTGFDENDNMPMCALTAHKPLHVVNMALNLVAGKNLAWQQRKAESFTSTRLHTGSCRLGYRPSSEYGGRYRTAKTPISLGTALAISGAAASPNMGYNSSPLLALVMTLFNARLGSWLGNPKAQGRSWKLPGPSFGVAPFIEEALGLTDDEHRWVYLSDGGHFDNLGLYEMVLRRCRYIVVSDAGADPKFTYEDLGNAVRKIRIDLGISIEFAHPMPMALSGKVTPECPGHHCAIGSIGYSKCDDGAADGVLIYLKPSLNGDEPPDVQYYAAADVRFPHQPTSDQFFDEPQFESYRRLGFHVVERIRDTPASAGGTTRPGKGVTLGEFVEKAKAYADGPRP